MAAPVPRRRRCFRSRLETLRRGLIERRARRSRRRSCCRRPATAAWRRAAPACRRRRRSPSAQHLVAGQHEEIGVEPSHVGAHMRNRLRAVNQRQRAVSMRDGDHLGRRGDRAERVGDGRQRDNEGARVDQLLVLVEPECRRGRRPARPRSLAPVAAQSCCHGTILAWCSRCVTRSRRRRAHCGGPSSAQRG